MDIKTLEKYLVDKDIARSSQALNALYERWDKLDEGQKRQIKSLETIYLNIVSASIDGAQT